MRQVWQVLGKPVAKGDLKARIVHKPDGTPYAKLYHSHAVDQWTKDIRSQIVAPPLLDEACIVKLDFYLERPGKSVTREWPEKQSDFDVDKLIRCVMDALSGFVYIDDSRVIGVWGLKQYADGPDDAGVRIEVLTMEEVIAPVV